MTSNDDDYIRNPMGNPYVHTSQQVVNRVPRYDRQSSNAVSPRTAEMLKEISQIHNSLDKVHGFQVFFNQETGTVRIAFKKLTLYKFFMSNFKAWPVDYRLKLWLNIEKQVLALNEPVSKV